MNEKLESQNEGKPYSFESLEDMQVKEKEQKRLVENFAQILFDSAEALEPKGAIGANWSKPIETRDYTYTWIRHDLPNVYTFRITPNNIEEADSEELFLEVSKRGSYVSVGKEAPRGITEAYIFQYKTKEGMKKGTLDGLLDLLRDVALKLEHEKIKRIDVPRIAEERASEQT